MVKSWNPPQDEDAAFFKLKEALEHLGGNANKARTEVVEALHLIEADFEWPSSDHSKVFVTVKADGQGSDEIIEFSVDYVLEHTKVELAWTIHDRVAEILGRRG